MRLIVGFGTIMYALMVGVVGMVGLAGMTCAQTQIQTGGQADNPASGNGLHIVAVVNNEIISNYDVTQRVKLALAMGGFVDNPANRAQVRPQVIRRMIDERLGMQEAKRLSQVPSEADIDAYIKQIEQANHMKEGALLKSFPVVSSSVLKAQLVADLTWNRTARTVEEPQIRVSDEEVATRLALLKSRYGQPEYSVLEIFLPVDARQSDAAAWGIGENIINQLKQGKGNFQVFASQFSQSPSAARGGALGWISAGMIDDTLWQNIQHLNPGMISPLIKLKDGYYIMAVSDRRIAGTGIGDNNVNLTFAEFYIGVPPQVKLSQSVIIERLHNAFSGINTCEDFEAKAHELGGQSYQKNGPIKLGGLSPVGRQLLGSLKQGEMVEPIPVKGGFRLLMMCQRDEAKAAALPTSDDVRLILANEKLQVLMARYLRNLRSAAFIDMRE